MHIARPRPAAPRAAAIPKRLWTLLSGGLDVLLVWQQRAADRWSLLALGDRDLKDIGLSRADVLREAQKPFWRP